MIHNLKKESPFTMKILLEREEASEFSTVGRTSLDLFCSSRYHHIKKSLMLTFYLSFAKAIELELVLAIRVHRVLLVVKVSRQTVSI